MKLVFALALLIASVTVFGATAQRSPIENELEELDLLLNLDAGDYALDGLVSTIRAALQRVLDRVKTKLGEHKELFEQFRAKIEEVQQKIRDLVKQGGAHLAQLVGQIREKLQALIKGVFDKIKDNAEFYEAEQEEKSILQRIVERVKELVQKGLDRLKERVAKFKDVAEQFKDKFAEVQEKLKEVGKDFSIKALDKIQELREKLRDLIREVTQKISDSLKESQYVAYGVEELPALLPKIKAYVFSDEGFKTLRNFAKNVQSTNPIVNFVKLFVNSQSDEYLKIVLAELFGNVYSAQYDLPVDTIKRVRDILVTDEGIAAIRKFGKELQSEHQIVTQVAGLLSSIPDSELKNVINELFNGLLAGQYETLDQDIAEYYEGESLLEIIGQRLRELAQKALEALKKRIAQAKEVSELVKEKLQVLQEQIAQLGKEAGAKAVRLFQQIRLNIIEILKGIQTKISETSLYEGEEEEGSLISRIAKRVADLAQRALNKLREKLAPHKEFFEQLRTKISEVQAKIAELGKTVGAKALEVAKSLRQKLRDLAKQIRDKLAGVTYAAEEEEEDKQPLLTKIAQRIRAIVERILVIAKGKLAESKELFGEFKEKLDEVTAELAELGKKTGQKALDAARALREKVRELNKAIVQRIKDKISGALYSAEDEEEDQSIGELIKQKIRQIVERIRVVVQQVLDTLKEKLGQSKELFAQFKDRVDEIVTGLKDLTKKGAQEALQAVAELRRKVLELARDIKKSITGEVSFYEAEEEEVEQGLVQRLVQRVRALVQRVLQKVKETLANREQIAEQVKDKIAEITQKLAELAKEKGAKAIKAVQALRQKLRDLVKNIREKIAGQGYYAGEDSEDDEEIDETKPSLIKRLVDRIRRIVERSVERIQERLAAQKDLLAEFKDKIDEVNQGLAELAKQSGRKALESARALRKKVEALTKAVIARITGKDALYSAEDEKEDQSIGQLIEKKLRELAERIRVVVQRVLETLKEKLGESKELLAKFGDRLQAIKTGLAELTKKSAKEALQALAQLRRKVIDLARDIKESIKGEATYESEEVVEEVPQSLVQRIIQRVRALVQRVLQKVKETLANKDQIAAQFKEKIAEITQKLADLAKEKGAKALQAIQALRQKLRDLVKNIREKIAPSGYSTYALREDLIAIRDIVTNPEGLQRLKAYLDNLQSSHPTVALVRAYVQSSSDEALLDILKEFFSGFDGIILQDYPITDLSQLFSNVRKEILTDAGIQKLKEYARNIETSHPVVSRIKTAIETRPDAAIQAFLGELFSGLGY